MKPRFPTPIERDLANAKASQVQIASEYEQKLRQEGNIFPCKKGCNYCCSHPFLITVLEGLLLYQWLTSHGYWTASLQDRLKSHQEKITGLSLGIWLLSNISCPLLEKDECLAYEVRPLHCRVTYSTGNPLNCHPHELGRGTQLVLNSEEIIIEYNDKLQVILQHLGMTSVLFPLSTALLIGAR